MIDVRTFSPQNNEGCANDAEIAGRLRDVGETGFAIARLFLRNEK